ncbi:MAG: alcohol dehydrogenase catalytic domain-containing protein [Planctomycetota bacterium]|nr:alcohol dehydrogenase catalytic domain-containing protein [Planctomycetota bacterium]
MQAIVKTPSGKIEVEERPVPEAGPGEALVKVQRAGICDTDLQLVAGYMNFSGILGHEFVGRIERADEAPERIGQTVVGEINASCHSCDLCRNGMERHCSHRTVLGILERDGAFAQYLTLPLSNLHAIPDSLPLDRAIFTEPLAAAYEILEQTSVTEKDALILGPGKLGLLCAQVLRNAGARVTLYTRHPEQQEPWKARGWKTLLPDDPADRHFDLVVETTGSPEGFPIALSRLKPRGLLILKTTTADHPPVDLAPVVIHEITVLGSRCGPFAPAIAALTRGAISPENTIRAHFRLEEATHAFRVAASSTDPLRRKVVFDIS